MKILKVISTLAPGDGGPYKTVPELSEALALRGHSVDVFTTNYNGDRNLDVPLDAPVVHGAVRIFYFPVSAPRFMIMSYRLAQALKRNIPSYDIVHLYSLYMFHGIVTSYFCRKYGVPYILQPHGTLDPYLRRRHPIRKWFAHQIFENRNIRGADAILYNSEEEGRLASAVVGSQPGVVVPLGLHLDNYSQLPDRGLFRAKHPELKGRKLLLYLSRINFKKGLDILVDSFAKLLQSRKDVHLVIAGHDGEGFGEQVRQWCQSRNILDHVTFAGMLSETDKRCAFIDADLFVLTSYTENFGVTILEAMVSGTPVLISDKVNIWREVIQANAGKMTRCDPNEAAALMAALLNDPDTLKKMGENGQRLIRERFDWTAVAQQQEAAYMSVLVRRQARGANSYPSSVSAPANGS